MGRQKQGKFRLKPKPARKRGEPRPKRTKREVREDGLERTDS